VYYRQCELAVTHHDPARELPTLNPVPLTHRGKSDQIHHHHQLQPLQLHSHPLQYVLIRWQQMT